MELNGISTDKLGHVQQSERQGQSQQMTLVLER